MRNPREGVAPESRPPFLIRRMTHEDLAAVMALEKAAFKTPWSTELLRRELEHEWSTILLVEEPRKEGGLELLGLAIFWIVHDELHVLNVATAPQHRRRGVGRRVMEEALIQARRRGCSLATLEVRRSNEPAIQLYKSLGFRPVGVRPNYYADEGEGAEDAIVMVLDF